MSAASMREQMLVRHSRIRLAAFLSVIALIIFGVVVVENMLVSCLLAFVLSYLLGPLVAHLERRGVDRVLATTVLFILMGAALALAGFFIFPLLGEQLQALQADSPKYIAGLSRLTGSLESKLKVVQGTLNLDLTAKLQSTLLPLTEQFFTGVPKILSKTVTTLLLAPFLAFFMIKDGRQFSRNLLSLVPNSIFELTYNIYSQINDQMGQFVRARLMEAGIVGIVTWVGLLLIGFPFALFLAIFAAVTNLIPYIGPVIGTIPAFVLAMINGVSAIDMSLLLLVYFVGQVIDAAFIIPMVVAKIVDLHPVTVIVVIIIGAQVMGVVGMLISIPVASALKVTLGTVFRHLTDYRI